MGFALLETAIRDAYKPRSIVPISEWAAQNFHVESASQFKGLYRPEVAPWLNEPLNALANPRTRQVDCGCCHQSGKTTLLQIALAHTVAEDPGNTLYVINSAKQARRQAKQRVIPTLRTCAPAWRHVPAADKDAVQTAEVSFDNMYLAFTGAES